MQSRMLIRPKEKAKERSRLLEIWRVIRDLISGYDGRGFMGCLEVYSVIWRYKKAINQDLLLLSTLPFHEHGNSRFTI